MAAAAAQLTRHRVRFYTAASPRGGLVQPCTSYAAAVVVASQKVALEGALRAYVEEVHPDGSYREVVVCDPTGVYG